MTSLIKFLTLLFITLCVQYLLFYISFYSSKVNKTLEKNRIIVSFPKWMCCIGFALSLFFAFFIAMAFVSNETNLWVYIIFAFFLMLGFYLGIGLINWKIEFNENDEYFDYTRWYGKKHRIFYKDCEKCKKNHNYIILRASCKTFFVDVYAPNADRFERQLKRWRR